MIQKTELEQQLQPDAPEEEVALANQRIFEARQAQWSAEAKDWSRKQNATYRSYRQKHRDKNRDIAPEGALLEEECLKKNLKRKRGGNEIARLPPPPPRMDEGVLFCEEPNLEEVFGSREFVFEATAVNEVGRGRPRFGRGGRLIFDRYTIRLLYWWIHSSTGLQCSPVCIVVSHILDYRPAGSIQ